MRYAQIRSMDVSNGAGIGVALFVQGCHFHCKNCFNSETWDFSEGKELTGEVFRRFLEFVANPYVDRVSILGGEPLADENLEDMYDVISVIKLLYPSKKIWLYTGYKIEEALDNNMRRKIISKADILVDGRYIHEERDYDLKFRGSKNQRVIDINKSKEDGDIVLWSTN